MLREEHCDLLITPRPPSGVDIFQKLLFRDRYVCFYDPKQRSAPRSIKSYISARHITVIYPDNERLEFDKRLAANSIARDIAVSVPSFYGVPAFLRGSDMLATMPGLLRHNMMREFACVAVPLKSGRSAALTELPHVCGLASSVFRAILRMSGCVRCWKKRRRRRPSLKRAV